MRQYMWLVALVAASLVLTLGFACALPVAGFALAAAVIMPRQAYAVALAIWLANQLAGFAWLGYPADSYGWGLALAVVACVTTWAALRTLAYGRVWAFVVAFAAYQLSSFTFSLWLGGSENYTAEIMARLFAINGLTAMAFYGLHRLAERSVPRAAAR